mmetsp:Transcript_21655/g.62697  ORF Transcript_21655/g.62697 Transcript_21655/m.62697 type:complete len:225 (-) Transcript_21655:147-821(-)
MSRHTFVGVKGSSRPSSPRRPRCVQGSSLRDLTKFQTTKSTCVWISPFFRSSCSTPSMVSVRSRSDLLRCRGTMASGHRLYANMVRVEGRRSPSVSQKSFQVASAPSKDVRILAASRSRVSPSIGFSTDGQAPLDMRYRLGGTDGLWSATLMACLVTSTSLPNIQLIKPVDLSCASERSLKIPPKRDSTFPFAESTPPSSLFVRSPSSAKSITRTDTPGWRWAK